MSCKSARNNGFTLIELLIVIVIIGILSGVLVAVINPIRQQNRSRNAAIKSAIGKIAFGLNTAKSTLGRLPNEIELFDEIENISEGGSSCSNASELSCNFYLSGTSLPEDCTSATAPDSFGGTEVCLVGVYSLHNNLQNGIFRVVARTYPVDPSGDTRSIYVFDSKAGFRECYLQGNPDPNGEDISQGDIMHFDDTDLNDWQTDILDSATHCALID